MKLIIDKFISKNIMPAYFIGAGISKRYIENYPNWDELLKLVSVQLKQSDLQYSTLLTMAEDKFRNNRCSKNSFIATELRNYFNNKVISNDDYLSDVFSNKQLIFLKTHPDIDKFKYLVAFNFSNLKVTSRSYKQIEIQLFQKVLSNASSIITTNYDNFIEEILLENTFQVFSEQTSYYMPEVYGYGEIYKIHGTYDKSNSIILTTEDYENYFKSMFLSTSKLVSIICEQPIIFIGYSLDDDNIKSILHSIMGCLSPEQIKQFERNIIIVLWERGLKDILESKFTIEYQNKTMTLTQLLTDNYKRLFNILGKITPAFKSTTLRKLSKMYKKAIFSQSPQKYINVNEDMINNIDSDKYIISLAQHENLGGLPKCKIYKEVLFRENNYNNLQVLQECKWACTEYFPFYYYLNKLDSKKIKSFFEMDKIKSSHMKKKKNYSSLDSKAFEILKENEIEKYIDNENYKLYKILNTLKYNYANKNISQSTYISALQFMYNKNNDLLDNSEMKSAICLIDYINFEGA